VAKWELDGMQPRPQSVTADWQRVDQRPIHGVVLKEVRAVPTHYGWLTEIWRADWALDGAGVDQIFQCAIEPGRVNAWHAHARTADRLFVCHGRLDVVLYDSRQDSPTCGEINEYGIGTARPALLVVPPRVWHGVRNPTGSVALLLNAVDLAYAYADPDHWGLPPDTNQIPYRFPAG
jgi:dTDP-4-dehydrorhamnose 3,5-epimerase